MSWQCPIRMVGILLLVALLLPGVTQARGSSSGSHGHSSATHSTRASSSHSNGHAKATGVPRDSHGRIQRSAKAKSDFQKSHPCPSTGRGSGACPGYVVDHVTPLKRGGADMPSNMQWQTVQQAKDKDRTE
jgi:hypothetical protein